MRKSRIPDGWRCAIVCAEIFPAICEKLQFIEEIRVTYLAHRVISGVVSINKLAHTRKTSLMC